MEKVKILIDNIENTNIMFELKNSNINLESESVDFKLLKNSIVDNEKINYTLREDININLFFYIDKTLNRDYSEILETEGRGKRYYVEYEYNDKYREHFGQSLSRLGFVFPDDLSLNVYKKSNIVFEFYSDKEGASSWVGSEIMFFDSIGGYDYNMRLNGRIFSYPTNEYLDKFTTTITEPFFKKKEGFLKEVFSKLNFEEEENDYMVVYYRVMVQNAKNGRRYQMISGNSGTISQNDFNEDMLYNEIRLYKDKTYSFVTPDNNNTLNFKELILNG